MTDARLSKRTGGAITVFVIEDEDSIRALMAVFLQRAGYGVLTARDGPEARVIWSENADSIGLLVADLMFPGGNGFALAQEFRQARPGLKVIFASGNPKSELLETTQVIKGSKMMMKPFSMKEFLEVVEEMVG